MEAGDGLTTYAIVSHVLRTCGANIWETPERLNCKVLLVHPTTDSGTENAPCFEFMKSAWRAVVEQLRSTAGAAARLPIFILWWCMCMMHSTHNMDQHLAKHKLC